ncbi:hypothetical protein PVAP13_5NG419900 [Panicum virgatum]|uniref:Uncharacterized protein n=1 Tax=Panicum virgatum TaxID=38727 RepID=A0A8T0RVR3_PANVG|nr:hypothetical protein PVAP13_5NG419900 [Panicum virgatum]
MTSDRVCVFSNCFSNCYNKIVVTSIDFIGRRPICGLYLQGEGSFWNPYEYNVSGSLISSSMVTERKSRFEESARGVHFGFDIRGKPLGKKTMGESG